MRKREGKRKGREDQPEVAGDCIKKGSSRRRRIPISIVSQIQANVIKNIR